MPTTLPRHAITETAAVRRALDAAARRWPEHQNKPARLLLDLIEAGRLSIDADAEAEQRRQRIVSLAGSLTDCFPDGYLDELREDWTE